MGDPAGLSDADRATAFADARAIVEAVVDDTWTPHGMLQRLAYDRAPGDRKDYDREINMTVLRMAQRLVELQDAVDAFTLQGL